MKRFLLSEGATENPFGGIVLSWRIFGDQKQKRDSSEGQKKILPFPRETKQAL
jgi:hypothetical protein